LCELKQYILKTERLGLRNWKESDIAPFVEMCKDPKVMQYFPKTLSEEASKTLIKILQQHFTDFGYTYFAVDVLNTNEFIGFTGLKYQTFKSKYTPSVDIGWRLKRSSWGKGYATEAARSCMDAAFEKFNLEEVYSYCLDTNTASEAVMKKIGMKYIGAFQHPNSIEDSRIRECVVYKSNKPLTE